MEYVFVNTENGKIGGTTERGMRVFAGIPYARAERFGLPETTSWDGVFNATEFGECCPQKRAYYDESVYAPFYHREFRKGVDFRYGENCLCLNVYAPLTGENHPVAVFVHGGSFVKGSSDELPFDGEEFCKRGVVLVTVNYRLGAFGFLSDGGTPFNLALHDQKAAVEWVSRNIAAFGGDPSNITLMGQSAGAMSVQVLVLCDEIKTKVKRAVLMSGGGVLHGIFAPHDAKFTEKFSRKVVKAAGVSGFAGLKDLSARELFDAWQKASAGSLLATVATFPCFDGEIAKKENYRRFSETEQLPVMFGTTANDIVPGLLRRAEKEYARRSTADCWSYRFNHVPAGDGKKGAWHSCDLWYVFGSLDRCWRPFTADDREVSRRLSEAVCTFATDGIPKNDGKAWKKSNDGENVLY